MSSKKILNSKLIVDGDMSGDVSATAKIMGIDHLAVQLVYDGDPVGDIFVEVSNDGETFFTGIAIPGPIGAPGSDFKELETAAAFLRFRYVSESGAGTLNVHVVGKSK